MLSISGVYSAWDSSGPGPGGSTIVTHWRLSEFDNMITDDDDGTSALITNTLSLCQRWYQNAIFSSIYTEGRRQVCVWNCEYGNVLALFYSHSHSEVTINKFNCQFHQIWIMNLMVGLRCKILCVNPYVCNAFLRFMIVCYSIFQFNKFS